MSTHHETSRDELPSAPEAQLPPTDPLVDSLVPRPRGWRREVLEFLQRLALGVVVFGVAALALWFAYQWAVLPVYGKVALTLGFERGRSLAELREDLTFLKSALEENHPALYAHQTAEEFETAFARVDERLREGMSASDLLVEAAPLVAAIGCGHTGLRAPLRSVRAVMAAGRFLPFGVRFVRGRTYLVYHYAKGSKVPRGAELLAINGRPLEDIVARLQSSLPSDRRSPTYNLALAQAQFPYWYWVFIDRSSRFRVRYRDPNGGMEREVTVRARPGREVLSSFRSQHPELDPSRPPPPMRMEILEPQRVAYLRLYTFAPQHRPDSQDLLRSFFEGLADTGVETLVIDVRGNAGGPPGVSVDLLRHLLSEPFTYLDEPHQPEYRSMGYDRYYSEIEPHPHPFEGRLFVLIGPGSFSTTGHFLAHLALRDRAIFVGRESGGSALCYDGSRHLELPHTHLRLRVATRPFLAAGAESLAAQGIVPDYEVPPTVEDLVAGRDTVLTFLRHRFDIDLRPIEER
jgi:hypothetical protein